MIEMKDVFLTVDGYCKLFGAYQLDINKCLILEHGNKSKRNEAKDSIKAAVQAQAKPYKSKGGVYVYFYELNNEALYVGKAKSLYSRIICHFDESVFEELNGKKGIAGDSKKGLYPAFFRDAYKGKVKVYWIEIDDEWTRRAVEAALHVALKPKFIKFQEERKNL